MANLCLFIPGLLFPSANLSKQDIPAIPALERLLAIASRKKHNYFQFVDLLAGLFELQHEDAGDLPIAAITHQLDDDFESEGVWMRADPVHLLADQHQLILLDQTMFELDQHDALVLASDVRNLLADYGMVLEAPVTNRWYLRMNELPQLATTPIHEVTGRDIHPYLPTGPERNHWAKLMNELQMCLHASPLNEIRRQRGELEINSLWLWGCGRLPDSFSSPWSMVYCDEEISRSCAVLADTSYDDPPDSIEQIMKEALFGEDILLVLSFGQRHRRYHDLAGWQDFISYLESCWFTGLLDYLDSGVIEKLTLLTEGQVFRASKTSFYKFWKRPRSIVSYYRY